MLTAMLECSDSIVLKRAHVLSHPLPGSLSAASHEHLLSAGATRPGLAHVSEQNRPGPSSAFGLSSSIQDFEPQLLACEETIGDHGIHQGPYLLDQPHPLRSDKKAE